MPRRPSPGRPTGQYTQAVRLFQLYRLLEASPEGMRIEEMARELGVTPRSIRRDLKALEVAQIELESVDVDTERRVRITRTGKSTEPIRLTRFQRYNLAAARRVFDVLAGTPMHDDLSQVFTKLAPTDGEEDGAAMADRFLYIPEAPKNYRRQKDQIYEVYDGVLRSRTLQFLYEGGSVPGTRKVEPYALVLYRNGLYVVGRDVQKAGSVRTFAVERMRRVKALTQAPFKRDPSVDVHKIFDGAFGLFGGSDRHHVVVDFTARVVRYVEEREWHPSQKITQTDAGVRLEMDVANLEEVVTWALRWGSNARVREPEELVRRVREEHRLAASHYDEVSSEGAGPGTAVAAEGAE